MIRVAFFGTNDESVPALAALAADTRFELVVVVTPPSKPSGRNQTYTPSSVETYARTHGLSVTHASTVEALRAQCETIDVGVVVSYGSILPKTTLAWATHGFINVHPSLLPRWRGAAPVPSTILNGDTETGVTILCMDAQMDHGPILWQNRRSLTGKETTPVLLQELMEEGAKHLPEILQEYVAGTRTSHPQQHDLATFSKKFTREDGRVNWTQHTEQIDRLVRAYAGWPGAWTEASKDGGEWQRLKITTAHMENFRNVVHDTEKIMDLSGHQLSIGTLVLDEIQFEGRRPQSGKQFAQTHQREQWRVR